MLSALYSDPALMTDSIISNGGQFEVLPVNIEAGGAVLTAALRVGIHTGIEIATPDLPDALNVTSAGCGIEVGVFANIAEFTTNVTYVPEDEECVLGVAQSYQLALGAAAGATVHFGERTWGPTPDLSTAIYTTELASTCLSSGTPAPASVVDAIITALPSATVDLVGKRQDLVETTLTRKTTYTAVNCLSPGLINCPASLQNTSITSTTITTTVAVPSGLDEEVLSSSLWPGPDAIRTAAAITTVAFGTNAVELPKTTGSPVPYVAPASDIADDIGDDIKDTINGLPKATIIGVSVGVGVPVVLSIALCCW